MTEREQIMHAINCAGLFMHLPPQTKVRLAIIGSALRAFLLDEQSGAPPVAPVALAPLRRLAIDVARGLVSPLALWGLD